MSDPVTRAADAVGGWGTGGRQGRLSPGPVRERLALVRCAGRQASGYLLTPRLVLTAAHAVAGEEQVRVTVPGPRGEMPCERAGLWLQERSGVDVALLASGEDLAGAEHFERSGPTFAQVQSSLGPVPGCVAVGFPYVQRDAAGRLDTEQLTGTYKPGTGLFGGSGVLALDGVPPEPRADGISPLAGMSGAAVFVQGLLLGVVTAVPAGWQHGRVNVTPMDHLFQEPDFVALRRTHKLWVMRRMAPAGQLHDAVAEFEHRYAAYLAKRHDTLRIFGIDVSRRGRATWPLDAAYYSLEAAPSARRAGGAWGPDGPDADFGTGYSRLALSAAPIPAEQALAGHDKVLLRGVAGSGKSTLVQWLAVGAARQDLGEGLAHLRGLVPYVLPLRTVARRGALPAPAEFLSAVEAPMTAPPGWAEQVLTERRGLVLVDGLDEIDEQARERVGDWLRGLLAAYPGNRWLVTSRPSAVDDLWLADEGFTELTLSPMSRADVRAFTARWHDAARATVPADDPGELARIDGYERSLLDALGRKPDLARLATNPLMCGLICALHRDRGGYLPTGRKELYDAALSMLLVRRDQERDLAPVLTEAPQVQLLQKLAYWLVKNGQAEMDQDDAVGLIGAALPSMPAVAALGDAEAVYRHLLGRSGLLREPTTDCVDFVHRTFQDYLAARAAVEDRDFELMTRNAHHDQWSDVIRMAVAHGRPDERARLLRRIVARGDRTKKHRVRLHLLAMACLEHATQLDKEVRELVEQRGAALIPPRSYAEAKELAAAGPLVLELLPGPEGLDDDEASAVVATAFEVGGDAAVPILARFTGHTDTRVLHSLGDAPADVDPELYAAEVLDRLPREHAVYTARNPDDLRLFARLGGVRRLATRTGVSPVEVLAHFGGPEQLTELWMHQRIADDELPALCALPALTELTLFDASRLRDLEPLSGTALSRLSLFDLSPSAGLAALAGMSGLRTLALTSPDADWPGLSALPEGLPVTSLYTSCGPRGLEGLERLPELTHLGCHSMPRPLSPADFERIGAHPRLTSFSADPTVVAAGTQGPPLPRIRRLALTAFRDDAQLRELPGLFPGVTHLGIWPGDDAVTAIDLSPLAGLPDLASVEIRNPRRNLTVDSRALPASVEIALEPRT